MNGKKKKTNAFFMHLQTHNTHSRRWQEVVYLENEVDWKKEKLGRLSSSMQRTQGK
jgi:hypothetical protein